MEEGDEFERRVETKAWWTHGTVYDAPPFGDSRGLGSCSGNVGELGE